MRVPDPIARFADRLSIGGAARFALKSAAQALAAGVMGCLVALLTLAIDEAAGLWIAAPIANVRTLLGGVVSAVVTLAVFSLWMRSVVAGLVSSQVSPRIVSSYLDDDFQWQLLVGMSGALTYAATLLVQLPSPPAQGAAMLDGQGAPMLSTVLAVVVVLIGLVVLLFALRDAVQRMSLPRIVGALADQAHEALAQDGVPDDPWPEQRTVDIVDAVSSAARGWVRSIDHARILQVIPSESVLVLKVGTGVFVSEQDVLAGCDTKLGEEASDAIRRAVRLEASRSPVDDLAFALQQLRDLAQGSMTNNVDTSTSHEVLLHLRTILGKLIADGVTSGHALGADGRAVVSLARWSVRDHLREVLESLVYAVRADPVETRFLSVVLEDLRMRARDHGDRDSENLLRDFERDLGDSSPEQGDLRPRPDGWAATDLGLSRRQSHLDRPDRTE